MDTKQFISEVNKLRLANKDLVYIWQGMVNGKQVNVKAINTLIMIFTVGDLSFANEQNAKVVDFKITLEHGIN